jgi:hypothetical protein
VSAQSYALESDYKLLKSPPGRRGASGVALIITIDFEEWIQVTIISKPFHGILKNNEK